MLLKDLYVRCQNELQRRLSSQFDYEKKQEALRQAIARDNQGSIWRIDNSEGKDEIASVLQRVIAEMNDPFRPGALLRMRSGDLGLGFAGAAGGLVAVSLSTGLRVEGYDLVFDRWTLSLRRGGAELLVGAFRPL